MTALIILGLCISFILGFMLAAVLAAYKIDDLEERLRNIDRWRG